MDDLDDLGTTDYPQEFFKKRYSRFMRSVLSLEWNSRNKKIGGCAACCFVSAILLFIFSFGFTALLGHLIDNAIVGNSIVDSENSLGYPLWVSNAGSGSPPTYECYNFFNLTNADSVLHNGSKPVYVEVGPYCYQQVRTKFNVVWSQDKTQVTYNVWARYLWMPDQSFGRSDQEIVVNVNPAYVGVISTVGSEDGLCAAFAGPTFYENVQWLSGPFLGHLRSSQLAPSLKTQYTNLLASLDGDQAAFCAQWANATVLPNANWTGMLVSSVLPAGTPSNISLDSCLLLFNSSVSDSLLNTKSSLFWYNATVSDAIYTSEPPGLEHYDYQQISLDAQAQIASSFSMDSSQTQTLSLWLQSAFYPTYVDADLVTKFSADGVNSTADIAFLQWGQCGASGGSSVTKQYYDASWFTGIPEFGCKRSTLRRPGSLTVEQSLLLLNSTQGIFSVENLPEFLITIVEATLLKNDTVWAEVGEKYGVDSLKSAEEVLEYFLYSGKNFSPYYLPKVFEEGGGLYTARSVDNWVFNTSDPLLLIMSPSTPNAANLVMNQTSEADSMQQQRASTLYTGLHDPSKVDWFVNWMGYTEIPPPYWDGVVQVSGTNDWGQFPAFLDRTNTKILYTWDDHYIRVLELVYRGKVEIDGVLLWRFMINNATFDPQPLYYQSIPGLCNLTSMHNNTPIFQSNPHMQGVPDEWILKVEGQKELQNWIDDNTFVDIEPTSGMTLHVNKSLQVNIFIANTTQYSLFHPNATTNLFYPIMYAQDQATATPDNIKLFNSTVRLGLWIQPVIYGFMFMLCSICLVASIVLLIKVKQNSRSANMDYTY